MKRTILKKNVGVVQRTSNIGAIAVRILCYPAFLLIMTIAIPIGEEDSLGEFVLLALTIAGVIVFFEVGTFFEDKNNYIEIGEGKITTVRKAVKLDRHGHPSGVKQRMEEEFMAEDVEAINSTINLYGRFLWKESYGGKAYPEEISFKLKNGANVIKDFRCFSFGDSRKIFQYIYHRSGTIPEKSVRKKRNKSLKSIIEKDYYVMKRHTYYFSRLVFYPIILVAFWMTETLVQVGYCFCMIAFYESVLMYYHKKNCIEIGEGNIVFVKKGNRTEWKIKDIQNITLIDKKGEILFEMADGRNIRKSMLFISRKKDLFYYISWRGGIELDKEICQRFRL